jgi:AcrR family transcriptional regulator
MQSIARGAGVGQGTLYRHFPTREGLVLEVHRRDVEALVASAPELLEAMPPRDALRKWLENLAAYGRVKQGLLDVMYVATHEQLSNEGRQPVIEAIDLLLESGRRQGVVRADVNGADILLLVGFLWRFPRDMGSDADVRRLLDVVVDGVTTDRDRPSPAD